jgi:cytochrome c oxidase subunit 2
VCWLASTTRGDFDDVLSWYAPVGGAVILVVYLALAFVVIRYRQRPGRVASTRTEAVRLELFVAAVLAGAVAILLVVTFRAESSEDATSGRAGLEVQVVASQWRWAFAYPQLGIPTGSSQQLVLPEDTRVRFAMTSLDVIHSFYVPQQRFKRDAFPNHVEHFDMTFPRPATHVGRCAEFCGLLHAQMNFVVRVLPRAEFRRWAARERREAAA